jgi:hypothetical protein
MTTSTPSRALILGRSLIAGATGLLPLPYVDDWLLAQVRSALFRRLAAVNQVDVDAGAVAILGDRHGSPSLRAAGLAAPALVRGRRLRRFMTAMVVVDRIDRAVETYQLAVLFEHYLKNRHVGFGVDGTRAEELRQAMDQARAGARSEALRRAAAGTVATARASLAALAGHLGRLLRRPRAPAAVVEPEPLDTVERALQTAERPGTFRSLVKRFESQLGALERAYLASLTAAFDAALSPREKRT